MSDGQGETPIEDIDTALPWAGIEDAPAAAETPALGGGDIDAPIVIDATEPAPAEAVEDDADLVPLQLDDTPDEEVTLVLTRDEIVPAEAQEIVTAETNVADAFVPPLAESIENFFSKPPVEVAPAVMDFQPSEISAEPASSEEVAAPLELQAEEVTAAPEITNSINAHEAAPTAAEPEAVLEAAPIADGTIVVDIVTDAPVDAVPAPFAVAPTAVEDPTVDFFERAEIEALHAPLDIVEAPTQPEFSAVAFTPEIQQPAAPVDEETNEDFAIVVPPSTPSSAVIRADVAEVDAEENDPDPEPVPEEEAELELITAGPPADEGGAGAWSIAALCLGVAIIACAVLIPQTDFNRRLVYEREKLRRDVASIEQQVKVNDEFLQRVSSDPSLAERLAQRQMKIIRKGTKVLELRNEPPEEMSPYQLVAVPPPEPLPAYVPKQGMIASACYGVRSRLYLMGAGLMLMAAGLVFGANPTRE